MSNKFPPSYARCFLGPAEFGKWLSLKVLTEIKGHLLFSFWVDSWKLFVFDFLLAMDASYDGTEVTVVMEEIEESYCYTSPGPPKKKKKYKIHGEKAKKPRLANMFW